MWGHPSLLVVLHTLYFIYKTTTQPSQTCSGGHTTPLANFPARARCGWRVFVLGEYKLDLTCAYMGNLSFGSQVNGLLDQTRHTHPILSTAGFVWIESPLYT